VEGEYHVRKSEAVSVLTIAALLLVGLSGFSFSAADENAPGGASDSVQQPASSDLIVYLVPNPAYEYIKGQKK